MAIIATAEKPVEKPVEYDLNDDALVDPEIKSVYPFGDMEIGQSFFVPVEKNQTVAQLSLKLHKEINAIRPEYAEIECDENGDEILETVIVKTRQRNPDGSLVLNGGVPVYGSLQVMRPKYIYSRNWMVYPVLKDQELGEQQAPDDGIYVVRVL